VAKEVSGMGCKEIRVKNSVEAARFLQNLGWKRKRSLDKTFRASSGSSGKSGLGVLQKPKKNPDFAQSGWWLDWQTPAKGQAKPPIMGGCKGDQGKNKLRKVCGGKKPLVQTQ